MVSVSHNILGAKNKRKKRRLKRRNPVAQKLGTNTFRQRIVPVKKKHKDNPPDAKEWD